MKKVLELKNVSKIYSETKNITNFLSKSEDKFVAVDNVSFSLESKKVLGLVGESGSGKSTCALMAMKLLDITAGEIFVNNNNITNLIILEFLVFILIYTQTSCIFNLVSKRNFIELQNTIQKNSA